MSEKPTLTPRDMELITIAFRCSKDPNGFQVDYKKFMDLAKLKTTGSACACWIAVKKKLLLSIEGPPSNGNDAAVPSSPVGTPTKPKVTPKKRVSTKPKAKAGAETEAEAEAEAEGENGVAADDEQTPTNTPKKKGAAKRKAPEPSSPTQAEANADTVTEDAATDENPAKKKRVYNRKPKDPNAPIAKPRAKKGATAAATENNNTKAPKAQLLDEPEGEVEVGGEHSSLFGDGNIKVEGPDELTEEESYLAQKAMDEQTSGFTNGKANGDEVAV